MRLTDNFISRVKVRAKIDNTIDISIFKVALDYTNGCTVWYLADNSNKVKQVRMPMHCIRLIRPFIGAFLCVVFRSCTVYGVRQLIL